MLSAWHGYLIEGIAIEINKHKNEHLFLVIEDPTGKIDVPIFADKK